MMISISKPAGATKGRAVLVAGVLLATALGSTACRRKARVSPLSKAGMSVSLATCIGWESGLGLGDDERTRPATGSGAEPGDEWPAHHRLGRHGSGNQHPAGAPAPEGLPPGWRRCHRAQGPWPAIEQQAGG